MREQRNLRFWWKSLGCVGLFLVSLLLYQQWVARAIGASGAERPAAAQVAQVWANVRQSNEYTFAADVVIKTIPLPIAGNIGRFSKTDSLYLEGANNLRNDKLQMALWGDGVSVADHAAAYQIRIQDGATETSVGDGEWQSSAENAIAFAPAGDFLAFLDVARNVAVASDPATTDAADLMVYTFDLDGRAYANKLIRLAQEQMQRSGQLPVGASLQVPDHLAKMSGAGELWVDERGLPVRQKIFLVMPPAPGADNRTEAVMDIYFTNYQMAPPLLASAPWLQPLLRPIANINLPQPSTLALHLSLTVIVFFALAALIRPGRTLQTVVTLFAVFCIVLTPALQAQASSQAMDRYATQQAEVTKQEEARSVEQQLLDARKAQMAAAPYQPQSVVESVSAVAAAQLSSTTDADGDGLNDALEELHGTDPYNPDSDLDSVADKAEIDGFTYAGKQWYGNPTLADTNQDGVFDGLEWNPTAPDTDGDGASNLYDYDDDNDSVPDEVDISRLVGVKASNGVTATFTEANPLQLTVDGLNPGSYTFVDLQLRPTNPDRLWYAFNVLNWPKDQKGNAQDWDNFTFYDYCVATGGSNCNMATEGNGDLKLVPMLEVAMPDLSNLPRRNDGKLDQDYLNNYGIAVQPAGDGSWLVYAPLTLVQDPITENKVAFRASLVYQASGVWKPQQARLVWAVNLLNEQYEDVKSAQETLKKNGGKGNNKLTILHTYYDDFQLTGFNVREDRGVDTAIVYEDPAVDPTLNDDDALHMLTVGLERSYFTNRDCDIVDNLGKCIRNGQRDITIDAIVQRWNRATNSGITDEQRWGIGNYLRVERRAYATQDQATMVGGGAHAAAILDNTFKNTQVKAPTLLFVQESRLRSLNADGGTATTDVAWSDNHVKLNFSGQTVTAIGSYRQAPYRQVANTTGWEPYTAAAYADEMIKRYDSQGAGAQPNATAAQVELADAKATFTAINITVNMKGKSEVLSNNATAGSYPSATFGTLFNPFNAFSLNLNDRELRLYYTQVASEIGSRMVWMNMLAPVSSENKTRVPTIADDTLVKLFRLEGKVDNSYNFDPGAQRSASLANKVTNTRFALVGFNTLLLAAGLSSIFALSLKSKSGQTAGEAIALSVGAISAVHDAALTASQVATKLTALGENPTALQKLAQGAKFLFGVNSTIAKTGAIGAAIGAGITWVVFFAAWGTGGLSPGSIAFNTLLAGAIAGTIVVVLTFILSLTVVGAIVLAIVAVFDLFAFIACKAGAKKACDISITGYIIKALTDAIYSGGVMIDTSGNPPISTIEDLKMRLTTPKRGLVAGNGVQFEAQIATLVRHAAPEPSAVYFDGSFFTDKDIRSTSIIYALGPQPQKLKTSLNQTQWSAAGTYAFVETDVPSPGLGWLLPLRKSKDLWQAIRDDTVLSPVFPFSKPQINQTFPLSLTTGMALPTYDCWFGVCKHKSMQTTVNQNLGKSFVLDILPATLDDFIKWDQLGSQIDRDGDGLTSLLVGNNSSAVDPNDTKWDTDGDGISDAIELRDGLDPRSADVDADHDGLLDRNELQYGTDPRRADSDGDGINDGDEVNGYTLTINGQITRVTSHPQQRDSDRDGISDGAERRLNTLDSVRYPFHPQVYNDPPVRLYTSLSDSDGILAVGASATVSTTIVNGTAVANNLLSTGIFTAALPLQLGGASQSQTFSLLPSASRTIALNGTAAATNGVFPAKSEAAADVTPIGTTPSGAPDDILLDKYLPVTIDSDLPNLPALTAGSFVQPGYSVIIGGSASDPTSYIAKVEVSVNNGTFNPATGTRLWAFPVDIPNVPNGSVPVTVRALDAVNNSSSANFNLTIDGVSPVLAVNLPPGAVRQVRRNAAGNWTLRLDGTASDALAGIDTLSVQIGNSSNAVITRTAIAGNGGWSLDYAFDDLTFNADPRPTGNFTATVTVRDNALPNGNAVTQEIPFIIDMTPPTVALLSHKTDEQISDGAIFTGTVQDVHAAVQGVEVAFVSARTVLSTGVTLLRLPLNDLPETVLFANTASEQTKIFCLDTTCPTSGVNGADGTAAGFDGNDLLRTFATLDLPESGLTTALWFNTTCATCGLFSMTQGVYPAITQRDRELYLDVGKVCSSILVGASREVRCSATNSYADGQWHQVVHTLGANGNALYVDGTLAVSSPTTASTFTTQDGVLVGYAPSATTPLLTGALDDLVIYDGALAPESAMALYRQWQPVTFSNGQWSFPVPAGLEGYYQIDMRATDAAGNRSDDRGDWPQFRGPIDTRFPTFDLNVAYSGSGSAAQTTFTASVRDANLTADDYSFTCPLSNDQLRYNLDATQFAFAGASDQLMGIDASCVQPGFQSSLVAARACDEFGHCGASVPAQTVAYIGTQANTLNPYGSLPNAIERTVLSDPNGRVQIIQRPGQIVTDIAVDESHGKLYWGEMKQGDYAQLGQVLRANLDGSGVETLVSGLTVYAPEALQIAVDPVGNKLYWTKGDELWWANLDGSQPSMVYRVPDDPRFVGGNHQYQQIGDVAIDRTNHLLYLSERRNRFDGGPGITIFNHSLIVRAQLNGTSPAFVAGAGPGCTYANYNDNLGAGIDPDLCVQANGGIDVEALTVSNGTLYWTAYAEGFGSSAVYGLPSNGSQFTVAPLALTGNSQGLRSTPLPHLYVAPGSVGVFVTLPGDGFAGGEVVRGEPAGEFTRFSSFNDPAPQVAGNFTRASSKLTALAVIRTPQTLQTQADLAAGITSPDLVLVNGQTGRYSLQLRNSSALPADDAAVTLTLPNNTSFASASQPCTAIGTAVSCDLGRFAAQSQQTLVVSFTVATSALQPLTATVQIGHAAADANPADNSASHAGITAAPTLAALPGVPYLYAANHQHMLRIPLQGNDHTPEPVLLDNNGLGGVAIAADLVRNKLILNNFSNGEIATVNPNGTGYSVIADASVDNLIHDHRLAVAVDEAAGRLYWTQINSFYLSSIKSTKLDGSDVQTIVPQILNQRGLTLDALRKKLLWVATDRTERENIIFRSNLDGSGVEAIYSAPVGQQIRYLAINPYSQKLYWIDPTYNGGALFWADSDGGRVAVLHENLGTNARGIVVSPQQNALYFTQDTAVVRSDLDGSNLQTLTNLNTYRYTGVSNLDPTVFPWIFINPPLSNLTLAMGMTFAPPACTTADGNEPNDSQATATAVGVGTFTAALCRSTSAAGSGDQDVYSVTVPAGQQITVTMNPPTDYNLYIQLGDFTADVSTEVGTAQDVVSVANYSGADQLYAFTVFNALGTPTLNPYTINVSLAAAPPQTSFTNGQCAAVDSHDAPGAAGNGSQANATPLTVGQPITGALCYEFDQDYYKFSGVAGQTLAVDLPVRPADYSIYLYRPNGSLFNGYSASGVWHFGMPFTLDASGEWAVAVADPELTETLSQYQLLVADLSCGLNDSYEPNNAAGQAATINGQSRIFATLCSASDQDYYAFSATAGQTLTVNYPSDGAGGNLLLQSSAGATLGQITPGTQAQFNLANAGNYRLLAAKGDLSGSDVPYMFQWLLDAPTAPATDTHYVYYANYPHLVRMALSDDRTVEPILLDNGGVSGESLSASRLLGKLYMVEIGSEALVSLDFDGRNRTVIISDANPDNVGVTNIAVAVDDLGERIYWLQPRGAVASTAVDLMSANLAGGDVQQLVTGSIFDQHGLVIDAVKGLIYWVAGEAIHRAKLDGSDAQLVRAASVGQQVRDLTLDPFAQKLYWLDPGQQQLFKANSDGSGATAILTGLAATGRGLVVQPFANELYYSNDDTMFRATLDGSSTVTMTTLSGQYQGPSNLNPNSFLNTPIGAPTSNLVLGQGTPILSPCALADGYEPNNSSGSATPLTVITETVVYGALCNSILNQPTDTDYYSVTVPNQKTLAANLTELPANYRLVILHPAGYAAAFSDTDGLADESGIISNTSGADAVYTVLVLSGFPVQNSSQYKLSLTLGDIPPPPNPGDEACGAVDSYDAPGVGNGTLATATMVGFDTPIAGALCYANDVDMYAFDGLAGQTVTLDLPTRSDDYTLTLYAPNGSQVAVISATTALTYGAAIQLDASGSYTVSVSQPNLTPTTDQYQLLVTDENCVASDANEPNNDPLYASNVSNGSRVRASLCSNSDVDLYHFSATTGQELTLNYPANATGAALIVSNSSGQIGTVSAGTQSKFSITASGTYTLNVANNALSGDNVPYLFQFLLGAPTNPPAGSPYIYYGRVSDLIRTDVLSGTVEPILTDNVVSGGTVLAADTVRGKLYILDYLKHIDRVNFDGSGRSTVVANVNPNGVLRPTESLAVDELSGRIYWTEPLFGVVTRILSANGDGSDVQEVIGNVVYDHGIAVDSVAGWLYWAATDTFRSVDVIRRSNLDGSNVQTVYAAPVGRQIRELALDSFAQQLYWRDPSQNRLLWITTEGGSTATVLRNVGSVARGFVVRPLENELYFSDGSALLRSALDGSNAQEIARLEGAYNGVSNLDSNVFYPTFITPPDNQSGSNLVIGFSQPFAQPCSAVDGYEPNDSAASAASIGVGTIQAALCTRSLNELDQQDFYSTIVPAGQQLSATLTDLPQNYGLALILGGQTVASNYQSGLIDKSVAHVNPNASPTVYTIVVERFGDTTSSRIPYSLTVATGAPPPPPPPPADACAPYDSYDQPGLDGNGSRSQATAISFNTPITAALCYAADKDYYAFDGLIGQNVSFDLPTRPADYYLTIYNPAGDYVTGIFPGSSMNYGDSLTLNASGRWTVVVWDANLAPTTAQYQLLLGVNAACSGLDPYEPNDDQFAGYAVITPTVTLKAMLCEQNDVDWFSFPLLAGQRIRVTPRTLTAGMTIFRQTPGSGFYEDREASNQVVSESGNYILGIHSQEAIDNLPYAIDIQIDPVPTPTPLPNNWSCAVYPSSDIPQRIEDLATLGSTVNVPVNGTVTHVGIKDIVFKHGGLWNLSFGLTAPDGTQVDLFKFDDYGFYTWCGGPNCHLSIDDGAIEGLKPPQFPNDGNSFRPSRNSFAPFNGKASNGTWTLLVSDNFVPEPGDTDAGDTTGDLFSWSLEVCTDNGNPPTPPPTPTATATPQPQPVNGTPIPTAAATTPTATPTPQPTVCTVTIDSFEEDDSAGTASRFEQANLTSGLRTFDSANDADWMHFTALANRTYTFTANIMGGNGDVSLSLFAADGTTHLATGANQVAFTPTTGGDYLLRAKSAAGIAPPCSASYSVGLTVIDPNATPVPTPDAGKALPPGHDAPPISAAVLDPADGAVLTDTQMIAVAVGLNSENSIQAATLLVNGVVIDSHPSVTNTDLIWQSSWTPAQAGTYSLTAIIIDSLNLTATSPTNVVYVDLADPTVSIVNETITLAKLSSDGSHLLHGTSSDDSQVDKVEVRLDGGAWQEALIDGNAWSLGIAPSSAANPNGGMLAIEVRATDKAGRTASASENVIVDITPPDPFDLATTLLNGTVISASQVISTLNARLSWTTADGATSIYAGWALSSTATLGELTAYGAGAGSHDQAMTEATVLYAHVVAVDALGNPRANVAGPFYFDSAATPDLIADLNRENWVESSGKQVGQMVTALGVQKLFAGWNADHLRLRWQGATIDSSDELYLYLGTGGGGSTDLFHPTGPAQSGVLPFAANYLVRLASGITPTLYAFTGSAWVTQTTVAAVSNGDLTDLLLPFADLGIADPGAASLKLVGVASEAGELAVWATLPDQNLGRTWTQYIEFGGLGAGIVPADGRWADTLLAVTILADPSPGQRVGVGDAISVTVTARNEGRAPLPSLTVAGATSGGVTLGNTPQVASNLAPSGTVALTLNGTVNGDGAIALTLTDSYHRPYLLETLTYGVDVTPPISVTLAITSAKPGLNVVFVAAEDESPIDSFDLEVNGTLLPCPIGTSAGGARCEWDTGNAAENSTFNLRARATDVHGNVGWSAMVAVVIDGTAPQLTLSAATLAALSDGRLSEQERTLTGTLTDNIAAATAELCNDNTNCTTETVLPDDSWTLVAPALGDGVTTTLAFVGYDLAGNASQPTTATVRVDTVGPQLGPLTVNQSLYISHTAQLFATGTVTDGDSVATVQLLVVRPDGSSTIVPASLNGTAWTGSFVFTQTGIYQIVVVATDLAGNKTPLVIGEITALYTDIPVLRPVITAAITGTLANNGWYTSTVTVGFTCADVPGGLGLATNTVTGTILATDGADLAVTNSGVCIDNGNNAAIAVTVSNIDIDKTPPVVAVTGVSNGATYAPGSVPTAGCSTNDITSGVATPATVAITGGNGDETGNFTATCSGATDNAGNNTAPVSVTYTVTVPAQATITIVLDARPKATTNFAFIGSLGRFILDDPATDDGDANPSSKSFTVAPGTYTVNRNSALNWFVTAIACTPEGKVVTDLAQRSAAITVAGNDAVTCTFTLERGSVIRARAFHDLIRKNANLGKRNAGDPWLGGWTMTVFTAPTGTVASSVTVPVGNLFEVRFPYLRPGGYTVCTTLPDSTWATTTPAALDPLYGQPCKAVTLAPGQSGLLLFGAYQAGGAAGEPLTPEDEIITDDDAIIDEPEDPSEDEVVTAEPANRIFLPLGYR